MERGGVGKVEVNGRVAKEGKGVCGRGYYEGACRTTKRNILVGRRKSCNHIQGKKEDGKECEFFCVLGVGLRYLTQLFHLRC